MTTARTKVVRTLVGVTAVAALAACSSNATSGPVAGGKATATSDRDLTVGATGDPEQGGTLTMALQAPPTSVNPPTVNTALTNYTELAYEPLIYRASDGTLKPGLAQEWKLKDGNKTFDMTLREGVTFSDGDPLTAEGVKAHLLYAKGAQGQNSIILQPLKDIKVTGPLSLTLSFETPNPELPMLLSQNYSVGQVISPTGLKNTAALTVDNPSHGAGPYVLDPKATVVGDHYAYAKNPKYYDPSKQHFDKIVIRVIADAQAALNALKTGQLDVSYGSADTVTQANAAKLQFVAFPFVWQGLNLIDRGGEVSKPLGDLRVRQAINYAIDRKTVATAVLGEYGVPTTTTVVEGGDGWSKEAAERYPFDLSKAKSLLAEAGYAEGFTLKVVTVKFAGIDKMTDALKGQLAEVGITLDITYDADATSYLGHMADKTFPAAGVGYGAQPMFIMGPGLFLPDASPFNGFHSKDETLSALFAKAAAAPAEEQAKLNIEMQTWLVEQAWFAPVALSPVLVYARQGIGGLQVSPDAPTTSPTDWYAIKK